MGAQGSQSGIAIRPEAAWGVVNPGQFEGINFTSEDMAFNIENQVSNNVRPDRQTSDLVQVGADCSGGFDTEFQAENLDSLLPGCLWDNAWHYLNGSSSAGLTAGASGSNLDFEIVAGSNLLTLGSAITHDIVVGQFIILAGFTDAANNGAHRVTAVSTNDITLATTTLVDETVQSVATIGGDRIRNGVTKNFFSIERAHNDVSQFFLYKGMVPNTLEMSVESGSPVMAKVSFVGKDETLTQTTNSSPASSDASTNPIINAVASVADVTIDDVALTSCLIQKLDFSLDNKVEGKTGVGVLGFCDVDGKSIELTGNMTLYFNDATYYNKYLNSDYFGLSFTLQDTLGNVYSVYMPKIKFSEATTNVSGKDDDVLLETGFTAIIGDSGFTIQITRKLI